MTEILIYAEYQAIAIADKTDYGLAASVSSAR